MLYQAEDVHILTTVMLPTALPVAINLLTTVTPVPVAILVTPTELATGYNIVTLVSALAVLIKILPFAQHAQVATLIITLLVPILTIVTLHIVNQVSVPTKILTTVTHVNQDIQALAVHILTLVT